jgi:putative glycerol-1-phosphate prenyltransferase
MRSRVAAPLGVLAADDDDAAQVVVHGLVARAEAAAALEAGADIIVIGNAFEKNPALLSEIAEAVQTFNLSIA